jgi:Zn-dependent membrane protease YugP
MYGLYMGGWGFMIISLIISIASQVYVKQTFEKYSKIRNQRGYTGADIAAAILRAEDVYGVRIAHITGELTDNFNPKTKLVSLSDPVFASDSISAAGVAAHECGHAIQYDRAYFPINVRNAIIPVTQIGSHFWYISVILGLVFGNSLVGNFFLYAGIGLFMLICLFQLVTLPVEFDASARALRILKTQYLLSDEETAQAAKVLRAAALTYVAALATSLLQLLRLLSIASGRRRR